MYEPIDQSSDSSCEELSFGAKKAKLNEAIDENENRICNITVPFEGRLPRQLIVGSYLKIFAKTDTNAKRFAINLITTSGDVVFHFNPRLEEGLIVRNSRLSNVWCNEEREPLLMPFATDRTFTLIISVEKEVFRLFLNGIHLLDFRHRLSPTNVSSIAIDGDVQVWWIECDGIEYDHNWDAFSLQVPSSDDPLRQTPEIQTFFDPDMPFVEEIPYGLRVGMVLSIIGKPELGCRRFDVNLVQSKSSESNPNIAFHLSVRFGKSYEESAIVRNYRFEGQWGLEDRYCTDFGFIREKIFDLRVVIERNRFILILNGNNFAEFPNRLYPLSETNQIQIRSEGRLRLYSVRF